MNAIIAKGDSTWSLEKVDIPVPASGEVLIKVERSVINPVDLIFMRMKTGVSKMGGSEGSGTVVSSGGGWGAWMKEGKRVSFSPKKGTYGEYAVCDANACVEMDSDTTWEKGSCMFVNPLTAAGFLDKAQEYGAKGAI